jgi:hypothetical protein
VRRAAEAQQVSESVQFFLDGMEASTLLEEVRLTARG